MAKLISSTSIATLAAIVLFSAASSAQAQKNYDPGVTDTEIKIGNIMPYSVPASSYATIGKVQAAYFDKINAEGGINGRQIKFISYDDAYSPPKAVEQTRKLVENDEVFLIFQGLGTPSNTAVQKYMNTKRVPQLFVGSGASKFENPQSFPWTMGWQPTYRNEGQVYGKYIAEKFPNAKVGVLWQNDDSAKDSFSGLKDALATSSAKIIADRAYEVSDPTVDSQVVALKEAGADVFVAFVTPKAAAQAIKKVGALNWKPTFFLGNPATSIASVMRPAGLSYSQSIISSAYLKDPTDSANNDDPGTKAWTTFMDRYFPQGDKANSQNVYGYAAAQALVQVLKQCGDDLTRENVMKQAASLKDFVGDMMLPGIKANTSATDYYPLQQMQLMQFEGESWKRTGEIIDVSIVQ